MLLIFDDSSKYYHLLDLFWSKNKLATLGIRFENFFDDLFFCKNGENITMWVLCIQ